MASPQPNRPGKRAIPRNSAFLQYSECLRSAENELARNPRGFDDRVVDVFLQRRRNEARLLDLLFEEGSYRTARREWSSRCGWRRGPARQCYVNAARLVMGDPQKYVYLEGFAVGESGPIPHAWAEDGDGFVIDPTWCEVSPEYLGLRFNPEFLCGAVRSAKQWEMILQKPGVLQGLLDDRKFRTRALAIDSRIAVCPKVCPLST
jgi:hypothetical protein